MTLTPERLRELIFAADLEALADALEPLTEPERLALQEALNRVMAEHLPSYGDNHDLPCVRCRAIELASFGIQPPVIGFNRPRPDGFNLYWSGTLSPAEVDLFKRMIDARDRRWRDTFLATDHGSEVRRLGWDIAYRLVRDGKANHPREDWYWRRGVEYPELWRDDPAWVEHDYWEALACPYLPSTRRDPETVQRAAFHAQLSRDGIVDRSRQLEAAFTVLTPSSRPRDTAFEQALIDALTPTTAELKQHFTALFDLVACDKAVYVEFAAAHLQRLVRASHDHDHEILAALEPAFSSPIKRASLTAVRLAESLLSPAGHATELAGLVSAAANPNVEVQRRAIKLLSSHTQLLSSEDRNRLSDLLVEIDLGNRAAAAALVGVELSATQADSTTRSAGGSQIAEVPLLPREPLTPIHNVHEFAERLGAGLEDVESAEELELLIDGLLRCDFCQLSAPERSRLEALMKHPPDFGGGYLNPRMVLRQFARVRLGMPSNAPTMPPTEPGPQQAILTRLRQILERPDYPRLLSAPTHAGGWIDPLVAVDRLVHWPDLPPAPLDLAQMLLRLAHDPNRLERARSAAASIGTEAGSILCCALGGEQLTGTRSPDLIPAWIAAEQARAPAEYRRPDQSELDALIARNTFFEPNEWRSIPDEALSKPVPPPAGADTPATLMELPGCWFLERRWVWSPGGACYEPIKTRWTDWLATVWPARHDSYYRIAANRMWTLRFGQLKDGDQVVAKMLTGLLDPREPCGEEATRTLAYVPAVGEPGLSGLCTEVLIAAATTGRLDAGCYAEHAVHALRERTTINYLGEVVRAVPERWVRPLTEAAENDLRSAELVRAIVERVVAATPEADRKSMLGWVKLLRVLVLESGTPVTDSQLKAFLGGYKAGTVGGRTARDILAVG